MERLAPEDLTGIGRGVASSSVFPGGFAATFFGTLLSARSPRRRSGWAAVSAASFADAVFCATMPVVVLHPAVPARFLVSANLDPAGVIEVLAFLLGMYATVASLGLSGRIRSRKPGT